MLLGEYNYASNFILPVESGFWAKALFVVFVLDMSVVLMNLILGMAVSDIEALQKSSAIKRMVNETMIVDNMETFFCFGGTIMPWMDRYLSNYKLFVSYKSKKFRAFSIYLIICTGFILDLAFHESQVQKLRK